MRRQIVLATQNSGKIQELRAMLADLPYDVRSAPASLAIEETGATFAENARLKALGVAGQWQGRERAWFLADDSGLEVDALGGAPGVNSARYGGLDDPAARNRLLLANMRQVPVHHRQARFVCYVVLADENAVRFEAEGVLAGRIAYHLKGGAGFGYDPLFELPDSGLTLAEIPPAEKNRVSHRGQALARLREFLAAQAAGEARGAR